MFRSSTARSKRLMNFEIAKCTCMHCSSMQSLRWICSHCCCCCFVLFCFCCVKRSQSHTILYEHILCAHHQIKCFARNVIEIAYKIITTAAMKWHNVSSAIWKWVSKIKCITIGIIVSFWAQTHTPLHPQKHINSYVSICSLCSFYWCSIFSYTHIENTNEHMNKLLLFSAAIDTAKSHGDSNE